MLCKILLLHLTHPITETLHAKYPHPTFFSFQISNLKIASFESKISYGCFPFFELWVLCSKNLFKFIHPGISFSFKNIEDKKSWFIFYCLLLYTLNWRLPILKNVEWEEQSGMKIVYCHWSFNSFIWSYKGVYCIMFFKIIKLGIKTHEWFEFMMNCSKHSSFSCASDTDL